MESQLGVMFHVTIEDIRAKRDDRRRSPVSGRLFVNDAGRGDSVHDRHTQIHNAYIKRLSAHHLEGDRAVAGEPRRVCRRPFGLSHAAIADGVIAA